jgi:hypothetical protein
VSALAGGPAVALRAIDPVPCDQSVQAHRNAVTHAIARTGLDEPTPFVDPA